MKWFRHMSDASEDEFIAVLENKFGLEGYARWWKILEIIAKQMDKTDRCHAAFPLEHWKLFLGFRYDKHLSEFFQFCVDKNKLIIGSLDLPEVLNLGKSEGSVRELLANKKGRIFVSCPKLLEMRDEYSRKSGHSSGQSTTPEPDKVAPDTDTEKKERKKEKEEGLSPPAAKKHFFGGQIIKLDEETFIAWSARFFSIPDLTEKLKVMDAWHVRNKTSPKDWFWRTESALSKEHQELLRAMPKKQTLIEKYPMPSSAGG